MTATLKQINARIQAEHPQIELVKGEGYLYFILDTGDVYETRSVMVPYISALSTQTWIDDARTFAADMGL